MKMGASRHSRGYSPALPQEPALIPPTMAFSVLSKKSSKTYFLHIRETPRADGKVTRLFYFSGDARDAAPELPEGYTVVENERTGLPFLKKKV